MRKNINSLETDRKFREYDMKVTKIAGYLSDYYIDRAIESEDFSDVSGFLIEKFYNSDIVYLLSKYKEFELDKKIEDIVINIEEWSRLKAGEGLIVKDSEYLKTVEMTEDEYISYMIEKRKKEIEE